MSSYHVISHWEPIDELINALNALDTKFSERPSKRYPATPHIIVKRKYLANGCNAPFIRLIGMDMEGELRFIWNGRQQRYDVLLSRDDCEIPNATLIVAFIAEFWRSHAQDKRNLKTNAAAVILSELLNEQKLEIF